MLLRSIFLTSIFVLATLTLFSQKQEKFKGNWSIQVIKKYSAELKISEEAGGQQKRDHALLKYYTIGRSVYLIPNETNLDVYSANNMELQKRLPCMVADKDEITISKSAIDYLSYQFGKVQFTNVKIKNNTITASTEDFDLKMIRENPVNPFEANDTISTLVNFMTSKWEYSIINEDKEQIDTTLGIAFKKHLGNSGVVYIQPNTTITSIFTEKYINENKDIIGDAVNCADCCVASDQYFLMDKKDNKIVVEYGYLKSIEKGFDREYFVAQVMDEGRVLMYNQNTRIIFTKTPGSFKALFE